MNPMSHASRTLLTALIVAASLSARPAAAATVGWRTDGRGTYPEATPPLAWSATSNIVWKTPLPAEGNATPILVGTRLFLCAEGSLLIAADSRDGRILWQATNTYADILPPAEAARVREEQAQGLALDKRIDESRTRARQVAAALKQSASNTVLLAEQATISNRLVQLRGERGKLGQYALPATHPVNGYASPTPTSDGTNVFVLFGTGVAACYDLDGNRRWARLIEKPAHSWGCSASPLLIGGRLIVHIKNLTALDAATGATAWQLESAPGWGSPVAARVGAVDVIVTSQGDLVRAGDGGVLARGVAQLTYCAPLLEGDVVYFVQCGGKAFRLPAVPAPFKVETLWSTRPRDDRYYASPVLHGGLLYAVTQKGDFSVIDAATGEVVTARNLKLGGTTYPSVTAAGGHIFVSSDNGNTVVLAPGRDPREVGRNALEPFRSSPLFVGARLYVRGMKHLYCIGQ